MQSPVWSYDKKGRLGFPETGAPGDYMVSFIQLQQCVCVFVCGVYVHVRKLTLICVLFFSSTIVEPAARFSVASVRPSTPPFPSLA